MYKVDEVDLVKLSKTMYMHELVRAYKIDQGTIPISDNGIEPYQQPQYHD